MAEWGTAEQSVTKQSVTEQSAVGRGIDWAAVRTAATEAMRRAYAPYSRYRVGAAGVVDDGRIVVGCNVENASYGVTLCAECGVVSALCASGGGQLIALSCVDGSGEPVMPCGRCRQLLWEHGGPHCLVDARPEPVPMSALLPAAFDANNLGPGGLPEPDGLSESAGLPGPGGLSESAGLPGDTR